MLLLILTAASNTFCYRPFLSQKYWGAKKDAEKDRSDECYCVRLSILRKEMCLPIA